MELSFIPMIVALIVSIVLHEVAHGYMADRLGDPTARLQGRLSPNPLVHIDPVGSVLVPLLLFLSPANFLFGWAKPVPYNPYNLRDPKWGEAKVAFAGPATNMVLAFIFAMVIRFGADLGLPYGLLEVSTYVVYINILLACFNLIPLPPLDGSKIIQPFLPLGLRLQYQNFVTSMERYGLIVTFVFIFVFINFLWTPFRVVVDAIFILLTGGPF